MDWPGWVSAEKHPAGKRAATSFEIFLLTADGEGQEMKNRYHETYALPKWIRCSWFETALSPFAWVCFGAKIWISGIDASNKQ